MTLCKIFIYSPRPLGEMAEWSNAPVLKTGSPQGLQGSNPCLSATKIIKSCILVGFLFSKKQEKKFAFLLFFYIIPRVFRLRVAAPIAQLEEYRSSKPAVVGSNPTGCTIILLSSGKILKVSKKYLPRWWNGRHVRLRCVCLTVWGFKSPPGHHENNSFKFFQKTNLNTNTIISILK